MFQAIQIQIIISSTICNYKSVSIFYFTIFVLLPKIRCITCGKDCINSDKLKQHMTIHLESHLRPYQCNECTNIGFMTQFQLDKHLYVKHSQITAKQNESNHKRKKFNPKKFKSAYVKSGLKREYSNPEIDEKVRLYFNMKCDICGIDMNTFRMAKRHYRIEHQQDGYIICCDKKFFQRHRAIDHTLQHMNPDNFYK